VARVYDRKDKKGLEDERAALLDCLYEYASVLRQRALVNDEGLRGVSAFPLYWFLSRVKRTLVVEVGGMERVQHLDHRAGRA
jgi:hypothetical protein